MVHRPSGRGRVARKGSRRVAIRLTAIVRQVPVEVGC